MAIDTKFRHCHDLCECMCDECENGICCANKAMEEAEENGER